METQLISLSLRSRDDYNLIIKYTNPKRWSLEGQKAIALVEDYYRRDNYATNVDREVLSELIGAKFSNDKHVDKFRTLFDEAWAMEVSGANIKEVVLASKKREVAEALALAIANGKDHDDLLEEYHELKSITELEVAEESGIEVYTMADMEALLNEEGDDTNKLPVYPRVLGERLGGGLRASDKLTLIARPEMGKTALILTMACGFARKGFPGVIFNNEEAISRLYVRAISNLTGLTRLEILANMPRARQMAEDNGFSNIIFVAMSPGSPRQIEARLDDYPDARWFVVDQLRNLLVKSDNKTNQLEEAAKSVRNIGKARGLAAIDVTQAGDSAAGKSVLDMGDVDSSNTGIPGACDVLLGVGANEMQANEGIRVLTPIKNKLSGDHEPVIARINPLLSKYKSI